MPPYALDAPLVIVHNYLESFQQFLSRSGDPETLMARRFNGDQAIFWYGDDKLVISSACIENAEALKERWGYPKTKTLYPQTPSPSLCQDILREPELRQAIIAHAGAAKKVALVPYASTSQLYQLAHTLEEEEGLEVLLPESPVEENLWVKDYIDTKLGFRTLVPQWLPHLNPLPPGYVTDQPEMVASILADFAKKGKGCVVKANTGGSGVGNLFLLYEHLKGTTDFASLMDENIFLKQDVFVIEEFIQSSEVVSPSLEFYAPPPEDGKPFLTYLSNQHFEASGRFAGVIVAQEFYDAPWYPPFLEMGMAIAEELQALGYIGHFDMDAIVDDSGRVYTVEINSRRTGGTYAHEFMSKKYGPDYAKDHAFLSQNKFKGKFKDLDSLEAALDGLLYPINGEERGIMILLTSALFKGEFGFMALGESLDEVTQLRQELTTRMN
jgi:hypothetical protein